MASLDTIRKPVINEINTFDSYFKSKVNTSVPMLDMIINYIIRSKGKQVRPLLVFLSAKMHGSVTEKSFEAAAMIELLHTATLVHDDIVDEAYERRGTFSVNALWKSKKAVLIGDFILSKGMLLALEAKNYDLLHSISNAVKEMSEGELLQASVSRSDEINVEQYYEVIRKKTAVLFAACTLCGCQSVTGIAEVQEKMRAFGEAMGMAFQIKDDLFDYGDAADSGKPSGNDIKDMKFTLPLICAAQNAGFEKKSKLVKQLKKDSGPLTDAAFRRFIMDHQGFEKSAEIMNQYRSKALSLFAFFPESDSSKSLAGLVDYVIERKK